MRIYISRQLHNPEFDSDARQAGIGRLGELAAVEDLPADLTPADAKGVVAVIADGTPFPDGFYAAAEDLRVVARWGVGFDQVNVPGATRYGVLITVTPVHMDTVAEYTIAQWMATMKRTYTFNRMAHSGRLARDPLLRRAGLLPGAVRVRAHRPGDGQARRPAAR